MEHKTKRERLYWIPWALSALIFIVGLCFNVCDRLKAAEKARIARAVSEAKIEQQLCDLVAKVDNLDSLMHQLVRWSMGMEKDRWKKP